MQMTYYAVCPLCGHRLLKAREGSFIEINCAKCHEKLLVEIKDGKVIIQKVIPNKTETE